ncbi:MAG TPA: hypothetical protein VGI42_06595, partial [Chthoniobacterales bacterium]
ERRPFGIDHPGYFSAWVGVADCGNRWQGVDDVTQRARFDNQDRLDFRFQISNFRLEEAIDQSAI